jgi:enoyl-CoA hydratase/carnithine racemase
VSTDNSATEPYVLEDRTGHVLVLTLNRPAQRNPLSEEMLAALHSAITACSDDKSVRAIIIASSGPVFSAGHDLREMSKGSNEDSASQARRVDRILQACSKMMLAIIHSPKAIIASVQGTATAAGCQLVSACDLAVAAQSAHFCTPGVNIGSFCTTPLVGIGRNVHRKHAMELALTGDMFSAEDAVRFGLVNYTVPDDTLLEATLSLAEKIASKSHEGIRQGKSAFYRQIDMPVEQAFEYANQAMLEAMTSPSAVEGTAAFLEKRPPRRD